MKMKNNNSSSIESLFKFMNKKIQKTNKKFKK